MEMIPKKSVVEGLIEVAFVGDIDPPGMTELLQSISAKAMAFGDQGIHAKILCDTSEMNRFTAPMRSMVARGLKDLEVGKVAFFGAPPKYPELREEVAALAGLTGKIRHFASREEALGWLASE